MALAFLVYFSLMIIMFCGGRLFASNPKHYYFSGVLFPILIFALIIGLRDNVGIDFPAYKDTYLFGYDIERMEPGYVLLNNVLKFFQMPSWLLFSLVAFLQIFFISMFFVKIPVIYRWFPFFYFTTLYAFFSVNGLRQSIAFSIIVFSIYSIYEKKLLKYLILVLFAASFHQSALLFLPFYFFINNDWLKRRSIQYAFYLCASVFAILVAEKLWIYFDLFIQMSGFSGYNPLSLVDVDWENSDGRGLGRIFWFIVDSFTIFLSPQIKQKYERTPIIPCYNLYFIGILLEPIAGSSYLMRFNVYFVNFRIIIYSFLFYWVFKNNNQIIYKVTASFLLIGFIAFMCQAIIVGASGCSPYKFIF